jgi:hypothetical protein
MALAIAVIVVGAVVLASFELWLFWALGERDDRRWHLRHECRQRRAVRARPTALWSAGRRCPPRDQPRCGRAGQGIATGCAR